MPRGLWPVDWMILGYLTVTGLVIAALAAQVPDAWMLVAGHAIGMVIILTYAWRPELPGGRVFRHWYPLPYVAVCYREMSILIASVRHVSYDAELTRLDHAIWGVHPTVWMEGIQQPLLTEFLQIAYSLFVPCVLAVALVFWLRGELVRFRSYAFLLAMGFLVSYAGYFIVPARGPRIFLAAMHLKPMTGLWLTVPLQRILDALESAHYDAFPSGHMEMTVLAWWASRRISPAVARVYGLYTLIIIVATVYLRYHYTVDLVAGIVVAAAVIYAAPYLEGMGYRE